MSTTTLSDEQIAKEIKRAIRERGRQKYATDGEFASSLELGVSLTRVKQVLGRMIKARKITRSRRQPEHPGDLDRPITFRLASKLVAS